MGLRPAGLYRLLYLYPQLSDKSSAPVEDIFTRIMEDLLTGIIDAHEKNPPPYCIPGFLGKDDFNKWSSSRGVHHNCDGATSTAQDYLMWPGGFSQEVVTNSLAPHYLRWFRKCVPFQDLLEIHKLGKALLPWMKDQQMPAYYQINQTTWFINHNGWYMQYDTTTKELRRFGTPCMPYDDPAFTSRVISVLPADLRKI